ncbi:cytochrome c peroxidase [uncultured Dokdonia sp.]|uniref:cytochrome-c peroxidase n=1 Tax=uncultured Dokdonia sp. TaxID=575653 RepID=UPI0026187A9E|nr:cytochrome c peroxidase [uncultured Dokdonia sp.]
MKKVIFGLVVLTTFMSCQNDDDYQEIDQSLLDDTLRTLIVEASQGEGNSFFVLPDSDDFIAIPQDPLNPITSAKVALGQLLLHDTAMGGDPKIEGREFQFACATCHPVAAAFNAGRRQGIGEGGVGFGLSGEGRFIDPLMPIDSVDIQPVRVPTLLNLAYQDVALWDGRFGGTGTNEGTEAGWDLIPENFEGFQGIEVQAMQGQDEHRLLIDEAFVDTHNYRDLFDAAFSNIPQEERYSRRTAGLAIAAFNRTVLSSKAPWQEYLKGDISAMTKQQKRGAIVFFDQGKCVQCHTGPALKDKAFHAFGFGDFDGSPDAVIRPDVDIAAVARGRGNFTGNAADDYKFKTPTLYNLVDGGFFGHGSTFTSVRDVVAYKNEGVPQNTNVPSGQLADQFGGLGLTETQINDLTAFLSDALRDRDLTRYVPEASNSGLCFPANDPQARIDIGCD